MGGSGRGAIRSQSQEVDRQRASMQEGAGEVRVAQSHDVHHNLNLSLVNEIAPSARRTHV